MTVKIGKYITIGTNDMKRAIKFYDDLLSDLDGVSSIGDPEFGAWTDADGTMFGTVTPYDGNKATVGNGSMTGFVAESTEEVDALHAQALSLGATDEGAPGPRGEGFYGAYVRDPDGNKLVFCKMG